MANTKHGLPQTKGFFKLRGIVTGMGRDNAFKSKTFDKGSKRNTLSFGVETAPNSTVFVNVEGYKNDKVYLFKRSEQKGQPGAKKEVTWEERYNHAENGFNPIGVSLGIEKDEEGKNLTETLLDYDAAQQVHEKLYDGTSVFVRGDLEYNSFKTDQGEVRRSKKFSTKNIYLSQDVDFEAEDFTETSDFKQKLIYMGVDKREENGETKFVVEAKVVTYSSIEDTEFVIYTQALANQFKKNLKKYQAIEIWGKILNKVDTDDVESETTSVWGEEDSFKRVTKNYIRELVITGADPESIDKETYTEEAIEAAVKKLNSQGQVNNGSSSAWGDSDSTDIKEDDLPW